MSDKIGEECLGTILLHQPCPRWDFSLSLAFRSIVICIFFDPKFSSLSSGSLLCSPERSFSCTTSVAVS